VRRESSAVEPATRRCIAGALGAAAAVALAAGAGVAGGPAALALAAPAALVGAVWRARADARARSRQRLARQDALTGLGNRALLAERLDYEMVRHARHERPLAAFVVEVDDHDALVGVARAVRPGLRAQDTVVRVGGPELCVLAPETDRFAAARLAGRLRRAVGPDASVGFALFPHDARGPQELLAHARADASAEREPDRRAA
jgi:diguanylate cyclase (GGDEF)-like protein